MNQPRYSHLESFRKQIASDRHDRQLRTLREYLDLFPGCEEDIAREFLALAPAPISPLPEVGGRVGHYTLAKELGRGGQGTVYLATDENLGRKVALKVLDGIAASNEEVLARFRREAMAASALQHPRICAVYEARVEGHTPYIAMQLVPGETLAKRIAAQQKGAGLKGEPGKSDTDSEYVDLSTNAPVTEAELLSNETAPLVRTEIIQTIEMVEKVARALHAAHEAGVIHRDIKPGNIMVTPEDEPILLDFGLARQEDSQLETMTRVGDLFGTPAYMSPEQLSRSAIRMDARTDVWSLGVVLFECLALKRPFESPTREGLYQSILAKEPINLSRINHAISPDLATVVAKALEKDRDRRYATAEDLAEDLRRVRNHEPILARRVSVLGRALRWCKRKPAQAALVGLIALTVPTVAAFVTSRIKDQPLVEQARRLRIQEEKESILADASYELSEGSAKKARALFLEAMALEGGSPEGVAGLAMAEMKRGAPEEALAVLDRHQDFLSGSIARPLLRRDALRKLERHSEVSALEQSMPAPKTALDYGLLAQRSLVDGDRSHSESKNGRADFEFALDYLTHAILLHQTPRLDLLVMRAHVAGHLGDHQAVVESAGALRAHFPHRAVAHHWAAFAIQELDDSAYLDEGEAAAREAIRLEPTNPNSHSILGGFAMRREDYARAVPSLEEAVRLAPSIPEHRTNLAAALIAMNRQEDAVKILEETLLTTPDHADTLYKLACLQIDLGREADGMTLLHRMLATHGESPKAQGHFGRALFLQSKWSESIPHLRKGLQLGMDDPLIEVFLGVALGKTGSNEEGLELLRDTALRNPKLLEANEAYAEALTSSGDYPAAIEVLRKIIQHSPSRGHLHAMLARAYAMSGRDEEALRSARESVRLDPKNAYALRSLGHAYQVNNQHEAALKAYGESLAQEPNSSDTHYHRSVLLEAMGETEQSAASLRACLALDPRHGPANLDLGAALTNRGQPAEALAHLQIATQELKKNAYAPLNLGITLKALGRGNEAIAPLREAIRRDQKMGSAYSILGGALGESGRIAEALEVLREGALQVPDDAEIQFALSAAYMANEDFPEAINACNRAIRIDPSFGLAYYNRGNALLMMGQAEDAVPSYHECLRLLPDHAEAQCNLGHALMSLKRPAEALDAFQKGHALGVKLSGWRYPSADWVKQAERAKKAAEQAR